MDDSQEFAQLAEFVKGLLTEVHSLRISEPANSELISVLEHEINDLVNEVANLGLKSSSDE